MGLAGSQCGPPPPLPRGDIKIFYGGAVTWERDVTTITPGSLPVVQAWNTPAMTPLPGLGFDLSEADPTQAFSVSFQSPWFGAQTFNVGTNPNNTVPLVLRTVPELHLFARDPEEVYQTLLTLPIDRWAQQVRGTDLLPPYYLPDDVVVQGGKVGIPTFTPLSGRMFWRTRSGTDTNPLNWFGIGSAPDDTGSIKAARVIHLPACSRSVPVQPLLDQVAGTVAGSIQGPGCRRGTYVDTSTDIYDLVFVHYLRHAQSPRSEMQDVNGVSGGLLVAGSLHTQVTSTFINSFCNVQFIYDLPYSLKNGFLSVTPKRLRLDLGPDPTSNACSGLAGQDGAEQIITRAFEITIPQGLEKLSRNAQAFPPPNQINTPPFNTSAWECEYSLSKSDDTINVDDCRRAQQQLLGAASAGQGNLNLPKDPNRNSAIIATIDDPKNWRCRKPTDLEVSAQCIQSHPVRGYCQFVVPVTHLEVEPDELRLSPFDRFDQYNLPGLALFFASFAVVGGGGGTPSFTAYQNLCSPPPTPLPDGTYNRLFASTSLPSSTCVLPPKLASAFQTAHVCACTRDGDCPSTDRCLSEPAGGKYCQSTCLTDLDCSGNIHGPACYRDIHLCGQALCGLGHPACPAWETCSAVGPVTGICYR